MNLAQETWLTHEMLRTVVALCARGLPGDRSAAFALWPVIERRIQDTTDPIQYLALELRAERIYRRHMLCTG
jgi:hypothetical protein